MAVTTQVTHDELIITLTGIDALWALKRKVVVSRSIITSAKVFDRKATIRLLKLVYRAKQVLVVTTSGKPAIIGVETPQPEAFAAALSA